MANGKKSSLLLIILTLVFILSSCTVPKEDINVLNICYKISEQAFFEGFEKENLDFFENDKYFVTALENGLYDSCYSKSDFKNRSFYFSTGNKENGNKEFQINRCKDTLIAMHLAYTLSYDSENFENEFMTWYPTIDFYLSTHSEFVYLILEHYDCTEEEIDIIVRSSAIREGNPELMRAKELGIDILHRSQMLAYLMEHKRAICVAGAHGKTTTSSMIALMLELAEKDPTVVVGGEIYQIGSNAKSGKSDILVAEADESDGSHQC